MDLRATSRAKRSVLHQRGLLCNLALATDDLGRTSLNAVSDLLFGVTFEDLLLYSRD